MSASPSRFHSRFWRISSVATLAALVPALLPAHTTIENAPEKLALQTLPGDGNYQASFFGFSGRTYFIQNSFDLQSGLWSYFPIIETGRDQDVNYGFSTQAPRVFVRLVYLPETFANPYLIDSDGDGLTNQQELTLETDPLSSDSDGDLIPDGWESAKGSDPRKASIAFDKTEDSDLDGLEDAWELQHFGSLDQGYFDDFDDDGVCNGEAQWTSRNPAGERIEEDVSAPVWPSSEIILTVTGASSGGFTLSWPEAADQGGGLVSYAVYRNNQPLGEPSTSRSVTISTAGLHGFQRWQVRPVDAVGNQGAASRAVEKEFRDADSLQFQARSRSLSGSIDAWGWAEFDPPAGRPAKWYSTRTEVRADSYSLDRLSDWGTVSRTVRNSASFTVVKTAHPSGAPELETKVTSGWLSDSSSNSNLQGSSSEELTGEWDANWNFSYVSTSYSSTRTPQTITTSGTTTSWGGRRLGTEPGYPNEATHPAPTERLFREKWTVGSPGPWTEEGEYIEKDATTHFILSDEVTSERMLAELRARLGPLSDRPWGDVEPVSTYWPGTDGSVVAMAECDYTQRLFFTQAGKSYRVRWLELFTPYQADGLPGEPVVIDEHEWRVVGVGGTMESEVYHLPPPAEPGKVTLLATTLEIDAPLALPVNDDFDERVSYETGEWIDDASTPSPVRRDLLAPLEDLGRIRLSGESLVHAGTDSVRLSVPVGRENIRLHALKPVSGNPKRYGASDWREIADGEELFGTVVRVAEGESLRDDWEIYAEGLAPGKVVLRLEVDCLGYTLVEEKTLYVIRPELVVRDVEDGETYPVGGILDALTARPAVELRIDSARLGPDGDELLVRVSGTVFDPISESLVEAIARVRNLTIEANGRTVAGLASLPDLPSPGSLHRPWQNTRFAVDFTRSFRLPAQGPGTVILRAVTSPNAAHLRGWDEAMVILAREPEGDVPSTLPEVPLRVVAIHHGEGPSGGGVSPAVLRIDGLADAPADLAVALSENDRDQLLAPLTFSPRYFYVVGPQRPGQPLRYLACLDDSVELPAGESIRAVRAGQNNFVLRVGDRIVSEAKIQVVPAGGADWTLDPAVPKPARDLAEIEQFYRLLYKRPAPDDGGVQLGMVLRDAFTNCGGLVQLGEGDEVERDVDASGRLVITVGQELDPISGAMGLFEQLVSFSLHSTMQSQVIADGHGGDLFASGRLNAVRAQSHEVGAVALELYKAAVSILSEPADWVMAIDEIVEGRATPGTALAFLPFVPAGSKYVIKGKHTGDIIAEFSEDTVVVMQGAMRAMKLDKVRGRLKVVYGLRDLRNAGLVDQKLIDAMVDSKHLTILDESGRAQLKRTLGPPPAPKKYEAHHWIPLEVQEHALRRCIDPNDHGQWLKIATHSDVHNVPKPGFFFKGKKFESGTHNAFWVSFFEEHFPNATEQDILDFAYHLQHNVYKL